MKARDQIHQGCLAGSAGADKRDALSGLHIQVNSPQHRLFGDVVEISFIETHGLGDGRH